MPGKNVKSSKLVSAPVAVTYELVRKSFDYERDEVVVVYAVVQGNTRSEHAVKSKLTELLAKQTKADTDINTWLIADAQAKGKIPAGTIG